MYISQSQQTRYEKFEQRIEFYKITESRSVETVFSKLKMNGRMSIKVYLICPVRNCSDELRRFSEEYVTKLESGGNKVHYPPRDVDQTDDGIGLTINEANRGAILECDEVHVIWDTNSKGSHFDFGMAFMLQAIRKCPIVLASPIEPKGQKSYENILLALASRGDGKSD